MPDPDSTPQTKGEVVVKRICARPGCLTVLSTMNPDPFCFPCQDNGRVEKPTVRTCRICDALVKAQNPNTQYCSDECHKEGKRRNNRAYYAGHPRRGGGDQR